MGLGYPGGPIVEKTAQAGDRKAFDFPRACLDTAEPRFSFSGLKTSLCYRLEKMADGELAARLPDLCASYQEAVVDVLARKTTQALRGGGFKSLGLSGGVANNRCLRETLAEVAAKQGVPLLAALPKHTGDNAGMIAFAAWIDRDGTLEMKKHQLAFAPALMLED
jgi:N6-L-threonylcarbamoyladenine synthase